MYTVKQLFKPKSTMRYPAKETAARHERILQEASRLFRERGIGGVSLPEIMKAAQLTHGPFYNHFESKEALVAESLKCAAKSDPRAVNAIHGRFAASPCRGFEVWYLVSAILQTAQPGSDLPVK